MLELLKTDICEVTFTKKDGSIRTMNCTLDPIIVPEYKETKYEDCIQVYDLDNDAWRAFKPSSVISIKGTP